MVLFTWHGRLEAHLLYKIITTQKLVALGFNVFTLDMDRRFTGPNLDKYLALPEDIVVFDIGADGGLLLNMGGYVVTKPRLALRYVGAWWRRPPSPSRRSAPSR